MNDLSKLSFQFQTLLVTTGSSLWRPPSFPPPDDWVVSVDEEGKPLSLYGDAYWDFRAFGFSGFNFGIQQLSEVNLRLVKQAMLHLSSCTLAWLISKLQSVLLYSDQDCQDL